MHAHFWMSGVAALPVCRRLGLPFVQTFHALGSVKHRHQGDADTSPPGRQALERKLALGAGAAAVAAPRYSWQRVAADTAGVYAALCGASRFAGGDAAPVADTVAAGGSMARLGVTAGRAVR